MVGQFHRLVTGVAVLLCLVLGGVASAVEPEVISPVEISKAVRESLKEVRGACVSVEGGVRATGVIISQEGYVLTAGHVVRMVKDEGKLVVRLESGEVYRAKKLGFNPEADLGLLRIENPEGDVLPVVKLAEGASKMGEFIFTYAHPSGIVKGRPAQVRVGRVTSVRMKDGVPWFLYSDMNIQQGDSGGPVFNLAGELVGINSSAAKQMDFNVFGTIDQFHLYRDALIRSEVSGDAKRSPLSGVLFSADFTPGKVKLIQEELIRRLQVKHAATMDFFERNSNEKGQVKLDVKSLVSFVAKDSIALAQGLDVEMGLDDPALVGLLPLEEKPAHFYSLLVDDAEVKKDKGKKKSVTVRAVAVKQDLLLTKASVVDRMTSPQLRIPNFSFSLSEVKRSEELDLVLLKLEKPLDMPVVEFPRGKDLEVVAGQLLIAPDGKERPVWNIATDGRRAVREKRHVGPMMDGSLISGRRAPFPLAISHALPLYAGDAGTPVFDERGEFVGVHIARFSRTFGLIIPHEVIEEFVGDEISP
ncbi:MAG: serine protease [Akkermansiaceae bacterium]